MKVRSNSLVGSKLKIKSSWVRISSHSTLDGNDANDMPGSRPVPNPGSFTKECNTYLYSFDQDSIEDR